MPGLARVPAWGLRTLFGLDAEDLGQRRRPTSSWRSSGSRVPTRRWISNPGRRSRRAARVSALRSHQAKTSTAAAVEARATAPPATGPGRSTTRRSSSVPARLEASIGATRCEPQRSCSFVASAASSASASYAPIALCSTPWYAASSPPRSANSAGAKEMQAGGHLARGAAQPPAQHGPPDRRAGRDGEHGRVLERQLGLGQALLDQRDHGEGLAEARDAADAGDAVGRAQARLAAAGDLDRARLVRTAAAQWVGPWMSRPLRRAIPPRRSFPSGVVT